MLVCQDKPFVFQVRVILYMYIYIYLLYIYIYLNKGPHFFQMGDTPPLKKKPKTKANTAKLLRSLIINKSHCTKNAIVYKKGSLFYVDSKLFKL